MASIPVEIEMKIRRYLDALQKNNIKIKKAILFGSYTKGVYDKWSDIDIALVSDVFQGDRLEDKKKIRKITIQIGSDIEPIPFNPADFTEDDPFVKEIMMTGVEIS